MFLSMVFVDSGDLLDFFASSEIHDDVRHGFYCSSCCSMWIHALISNCFVDCTVLVDVSFCSILMFC